MVRSALGSQFQPVQFGQDAPDGFSQGLGVGGRAGGGEGLGGDQQGIRGTYAGQVQMIIFAAEGEEIVALVGFGKGGNVTGGEKGGQIVAKGTPEEVSQNKESLTGKVLDKVLFKRKPTNL